MNPLRISIIVAARNEAHNLPVLLKSFEILLYPVDHFEIIIVDDNSTDSTFCKAEEYKTNLTNLKTIKAENKTYPGKKGALALGINYAKNDYILITDADCSVNPAWLNQFSDKFSEGYDFVFGNAPFLTRPGFVNALARFDNLRTFFLYILAFKLRLSYSCAARNFGFKKSSFYKIKGYENTTETLSGDDDLLIREAVKHNMKIGYIGNKEASIYSNTKDNFKDYLIQKTRHTKTSLYYLPTHKFLLAGWHIINLICLFSICLISYNIWFSVPFLLKIIADIVIVKSNESKFSYKFPWTQIIYLQIIYELLIIVNFGNALIKKDKWK
jgi:glycosyltransferase involved in cell wall biosynthesis